MKVLKFGGSSLATTGRIRDVARIVLDAVRREPVIVVLSAFQGVTNQLLECASLAEKADRRYEAAFKRLVHRHRSAVNELLEKRRRAPVRSQVDELLSELREVLHGIQLLGHGPSRALDLVASFGERLSALIVSAHLAGVRPASFVDARHCIITDD